MIKLGEKQKKYGNLNLLQALLNKNRPAIIMDCKRKGIKLNEYDSVADYIIKKIKND